MGDIASVTPSPQLTLAVVTENQTGGGRGIVLSTTASRHYRDGLRTSAESAESPDGGAGDTKGNLLSLQTLHQRQSP